MKRQQLSLRARPLPKPPPPGVTLAEGSLGARDLRLKAKAKEERIARPLTHDVEVTEQREAKIQRSEEAITQRLQELRDREIAIEQANREACERLLLAEKREASLEEKEQLLKDHAEDLKNAILIERLQVALENQAKENRSLKRQLESISTEANKQTSPTGSELTQTSLEESKPAPDAKFDESTSILAEREAYIEASEEALLMKAHKLEELECHLRQWEEELSKRAESA